MTVRSFAVPYLLSAETVAAFFFGSASFAGEGGAAASFGFAANAVLRSLARPEADARN